MLYEELEALVGNLRFDHTFSSIKVELREDHNKGAVRFTASMQVQHRERDEQGRVQMVRLISRKQVNHWYPHDALKEIRALVHKLVIHEADECLYLCNTRYFDPHIRQDAEDMQAHAAARTAAIETTRKTNGGTP